MRQGTKGKPNMANETQETLTECITRLGLTISSQFVPFSQSRNAK
jgi:hypothetical protein